jgi:hypothetical protein
MMHSERKTRSIAIIMGTLLILFLFSGSLKSKRIIASFVGTKVCKKCHGSNAIGNQYKVWLTSPHAKAYQILNTSKSLIVAKKIGIKNPSDNLKCLRCHSTGGGNVPGIKEEGVGCEACHGPGSRYFDFSNHASFYNRESAYGKAIKLGMYPIIGIDGIRSREKLCRHCHNEKRPCFPEDIVEKKRQKLPLALIADFIFKHPIRR